MVRAALLAPCVAILVVLGFSTVARADKPTCAATCAYVLGAFELPAVTEQDAGFDASAVGDACEQQCVRFAQACAAQPCDIRFGAPPLYQGGEGFDAIARSCSEMLGGGGHKTLTTLVNTRAQRADLFERCVTPWVDRTLAPHEVPFPRSPAYVPLSDDERGALTEAWSLTPEASVIFVFVLLPALGVVWLVQSARILGAVGAWESARAAARRGANAEHQDVIVSGMVVSVDEGTGCFTVRDAAGRTVYVSCPAGSSLTGPVVALDALVHVRGPLAKGVAPAEGYREAEPSLVLESIPGHDVRWSTASFVDVARRAALTTAVVMCAQLVVAGVAGSVLLGSYFAYGAHGEVVEARWSFGAEVTASSNAVVDLTAGPAVEGRSAPIPGALHERLFRVDPQRETLPCIALHGRIVQLGERPALPAWRIVALLAVALLVLLGPRRWLRAAPSAY